jgi:hypothetical protein
MSKIQIDDSRWPLVVFTAVGEQTPDELEAYLAECESLLRRREPYGVIFDARRAAPIGPKLRQRAVEWLARNDALLRTYVAGNAMVMATALQRGVFRAILWMRPLPFPYSIETTLEGARAFVLSRLMARGCPPPPRFESASVLLPAPRERLRRGMDSR